MASTLAFPPPKSRIVPEINVTPLVDVVLVLLIIFMVIAPQLEAGERVELPGIVNVDPKSKLDSVTLTMTASGRLLLEKDPVDPAGLQAALRDIHAREPDKRLVLKADKGIKYGEMRKIFDDVQKVGFLGTALMVDEKKKAKN